MLGFITPRFITKKYNCSCQSAGEDIPRLIVSNHVTNTDPFFIGLMLKDCSPPAFVASEHLLRLGLVSKLIGWMVEIIPRSKAASGAGTVKACLRALRGGRTVVLFAEGDCTWDGITHPVFPATGKLAKAANVPLMTCRIEGGYLSHPRWAAKTRPMKVYGRIVREYSPSELKAMSAEEVAAAIDADVFEDAWARQRSEPAAIPGGARAEGLEKALVVCPKCGGLGTMSSKDNTVFCRECGMNAFVGEYGFFEKGARFETVADWERWQRERLSELVGKGGAKAAPALYGKLARLHEGGKRQGRPKKAELKLEPGLDGMRAGDLRLRFDEIEDMSMVKTERLLFFCDGGYYEFKCKNGPLRLPLLVWQAQRGRAEEGK